MRAPNLAHFTFRQMLELEACTRCGECIRWCPTFNEAERDEITPLEKISRFRSFVKGAYGGFIARLFGHRPPQEEDWERFSSGVYDCTLCGRCKVVCPVGIDTRPLWLAMREQMVELGKYPSAFDALRHSVSEVHNISGDPNERRVGWADNLERKPEGLERKEGAEFIYFVGCVSSFYPMAYGIPQSFVMLMEKAGVNFTTLGGEEWCCGFPLLIAGMSKAAEECIRHNVEAVRRLGARVLVTTCPSCYHTWKSDYPRILGEPLGFEVMHSSQLLVKLLEEGSIEPRPLEARVTYHDPCDLGRTSGIYDEPRQVILSIPGVELVEMEETREYSLCCGGGGDVEMGNPQLVSAVARRRISQARATGATYLLSACQQCKRTLQKAARAEKVRIRVMDITEFLYRVL